MVREVIMPTKYILHVIMLTWIVASVSSLLTETNFIHKNAHYHLQWKEEKDQSAYCLFLFVSAGKKKNVFAALRFKIYLFPFGNTFKLYFCFPFVIAFLCHYTFAKAVLHACQRGEMYLFLRNKEVWIVCMKVNLV